MRKIILALSLCAPLVAVAQQPAAKAHVIALKAARLFDGTSDNVVKNGVVVIEGDRILSVGGPIPAGAEVIDLGDATLLPGLIDAHVHLSMEASNNYFADFYQGMMRQPVEQALLASTYARKTVEAGFTTVRNVGATDYIDVALRNAINSGWIVGPRMLVAVHAIGSTGGHADMDALPPATGVPQLGPIDGVCNGPWADAPIAG